MRAKIITVVNQKGGSGKTTLCMNLAGYLAEKKHNVLVVDADPQGTATRWSSSAPEEKPFPASVSGLSAAGEGVHREVKKFIDKFDYILIDCPPAIESSAPQSALIVSDLAIIPVVPSPADLWATKGISKLIGMATSINESLKALIVPNMCLLNTNLANEVVDILKDFDVPMSKTVLRQRNIYREAAVYGLPVQKMGSKAKDAVNEIAMLAKEVEKLLKTSGSNIKSKAA